MLGTLVEASSDWAGTGPKPTEILVLFPLGVLVHVVATVASILAAHKQALYNLLHCNVPVVPNRLGARRASLPNPLATRRAGRVTVLALNHGNTSQFRVSQKKTKKQNQRPCTSYSNKMAPS